MRSHLLALAVWVFSLAVAPIFAADDGAELAVGSVETRKKRSTRLFIETHPTDARVDLDGVTLGLSDGLFHVSPGVHTVTVALSGFQTQHREISIGQSEIGRVVLALEKQSAQGPVEIVPVAVAMRGRSFPRPDIGEPDFPWGSLAPVDEPTAALSLEGHRRYVNWVEFSPDGRILASASADNTIRLWRVPSGRLRHALVVKDSRSGVYCATFSPDGQTLASCAGTTVQLWDVETGRMRASSDTFKETPRGAAFAVNGATLAVAVGEDRLVLCHPETLDVRSDRRRRPDLKKTLLDHDDSVRRIADSQDGELLAFAGGWHPRDPGRLAVWRANGHTASLLSSFEVPDGYVRAVAFSPDGRFVAYAAGTKVKLVETVKLPRVRPRR